MAGTFHKNCFAVRIDEAMASGEGMAQASKHGRRHMHANPNPNDNPDPDPDPDTCERAYHGACVTMHMHVASAPYVGG